MKNGRIKQYIELINLRFIVISLILLMTGFFLLWITLEDSSWVNAKILQLLLGEIGSLLLVSVMIGLIWELIGKRSFLDEILIKTRLSNDILSAGISRIPKSFRTDIEWKEYFKNVTELDIFFSYGRTWRHTNINELRTIAKRKDVIIRIIMPDYEDDLTIDELARRFDYSPEELTKCIEEAEEEFIKIFPQTEDFPAKMELRYIKSAPVYTFFRFNNQMIFTLFSHLKKRELDVPTFICKEPGLLFKFFREQFEGMIDNNFASLK